MSDEQSPAVGRSIQIGRDAIGNAIISGDGNIVVIESTRLHAAEEPAPPSAADIGPNPYMGLLAFQETDADRFFGRKQQTARLWERLRDLHSHVSGKRPTRLLPVLGPSGSGKSSLARAGLIAELARRPLPGMRRARVGVMAPGAHPVEALAAVLARIATNDRTPVAKTTEFEAALKRPNEDGECDGLRRIADALPDIAGAPLIVLVDQFEEIYSLCQDKNERTLFIDNLLLAARDAGGHLSVVITLRTDFLGETQTHEALNALICEHQVMIPAMNEEELRQAIARPAELAGHPLDEATITLLLNDTRDRDGVLPLLQFALTRIWDGLANGVEPAVTYREIGGVGGALAGEAQRIYQSLNDQEKRIAKRVFLGLVQLGEGTRDTRRRANVKSLIGVGDDPTHVEGVIRRFSAPDARLITLSADERGGADNAEVTHEALFDHWRQLSNWVEDSRDDVRFQRRLDDVAVNWSEQGRAEGGLWRPPDLDLLTQFHERAAADLTSLQMEFFNASRTAESRRIETKQREERRLRRRTLIATSAAITACVLLGISIVLWRSAMRANALVVTSLDASQVPTAVIDKDGQCLYANDALVQLFAGELSKKDLLDQNVFELPNWKKWGMDKMAQKAFDTQKMQRMEIWETSTGQPLSRDAVFVPYDEGDMLQVTLPDNKPRKLAEWESYKANIAAADAALLAAYAALVAKPKRPTAAANALDSAGRRLDLALKHQESWEGFYLSNLTNEISAERDDGSRIEPVLALHPFDRSIRLWDDCTGEEDMILTGHEEGVLSVAYSPDGKRIAAGSKGIVSIWSTETGQLLGTLTGHDGEIRSVAFSLDGELIASVGRDDNTVRIWNARSYEELESCSFDASVISVAFSPKRSQIAVGDYDGGIAIWDGVTGGKIIPCVDPELADGEPEKAHSDIVFSLDFSPDGQTLASGSRDKTVKLWNAHTGEFMALPYGHEGSVDSVAFSPDGNYIASGSRDWTIKIWNVLNAEANPKTLDGHEGEVFSVAISPDGTRLASGAADKTVRLWDFPTGELIAILRGHSKTVHAVAFSPDGTLIASGSADKTLSLWDAATNESVPKAERSAVRFDIAFAPAGGQIFSSLAHRTREQWKIGLWDALAGNRLATFGEYRDSPARLAVSPDGTVLASADHEGIRLWNIFDRTQIGRTLPSVATDIAFGPPDGKIIAAAVGNNIEIWNIATNKRTVLSGHAKEVCSIAFSSGGERLISGARDHTVKIWDVSKAKLVESFTDHEDEFLCVAYGPNGEYVAMGSQDGTVMLWNIATGAVDPLSGHNDAVLSVAFNPAGDRLVSGAADNSIKIWDTARGDELLTLRAQRSSVTGVAFSPDGKRIVSASNDGTILFWDSIALAEPKAGADVSLILEEGASVSAGSSDAQADE